jgi:hypothetical protein
MQLNDASRIIDVIDQRIRKATASESRVETTWGKVAAVSADGRYADLYLYGESAPYASEYFRLPNGLSVNVNDSVKAAIDRDRGDRWVEEVHSFSAYNKVEFDIVDGQIRFGSGSGAPDTMLYRAGVGTLATDGDFLTDGDLEVAGGNIQLGADVNLYRGAAGKLMTDDVFHAVGGLRVTTPASTDGQNFEALRVVLPNNGYVGAAQYISGDANPVFKLSGSGRMEFGAGGASAIDTRLYRSAAGVIRIESLTSADEALQIGDDAQLYDIDTANALGLKGVQDATAGTLFFGSGETVQIGRWADDVLYTPDEFRVGAPLTAGSSGVVVRPSGSVEIVANASTPYLDFKNAASDDYDARLIYNLNGAGRLELIGTDLEAPGINMTGVTTNTTFSVNGGGTATFGSKSLVWARLGPWVFVSISFSVTANGSGATTVTITGTGLPDGATGGHAILDRGGTGVQPILCRLTNSAGELTISRMNRVSVGASYTDQSAIVGADLVNGASYAGSFVYRTSEAF